MAHCPACGLYWHGDQRVTWQLILCHTFLHVLSECAHTASPLFVAVAKLGLVMELPLSLLSEQLRKSAGALIVLHTVCILRSSTWPGCLIQQPGIISQQILFYDCFFFNEPS